MEEKFTINQQKIIDLFFNFPTSLFSAREIARLTKITHPTVLTALKIFQKKGIVREETVKNSTKKGKNIGWKSDQENIVYRKLKKINNLTKIYSSNLIQKIVKETAPDAIVLFGSFSRGEDIEESDVDIFVQSKERELNLKKYENKLHREINLSFANNTTELKKEFLQNIINGIVLYGYLEVD
jgi:predicted nucleotidyltransferase